MKWPVRVQFLKKNFCLTHQFLYDVTLNIWTSAHISFQLEEEAEFKEFLSVHQNRSQAPTWANDTAQEAPDPDKKKKTTQSKKKPASDDYLNFDSDQSEEDKEDEEEENDESEDEGW